MNTNPGEGRRVERGSTLHHNITDQTIEKFSNTDEKTHHGTQFDTGL
ncbi:hypothetical protein SAMN05216226_1424 [Halovenus aranensis]|uniref:Uncharacterized protein n=1 Tax=Halovenus aranensis TaxID=890420 RepID=A0A1G8ZZ58_9EURY|nr:hypothetical protein SAMN05216226_1424 [Halovenus aranensis]